MSSKYCITADVPCLWLLTTFLPPPEMIPEPWWQLSHFGLSTLAWHSFQLPFTAERSPPNGDRMIVHWLVCGRSWSNRKRVGADYACMFNIS